MGETVETGLSIEVRRDSDVGEYLIGVTFDGAFIPLARPTIGFVEELVARAKENEPSSTPTPEPTSDTPSTPETPPPATA